MISTESSTPSSPTSMTSIENSLYSANKEHYRLTTLLSFKRKELNNAKAAREQLDKALNEKSKLQKQYESLCVLNINELLDSNDESISQFNNIIKQLSIINDHVSEELKTRIINVNSGSSISDIEEEIELLEFKLYKNEKYVKDITKARDELLIQQQNNNNIDSNDEHSIENEALEPINTKTKHEVLSESVINDKLNKLIIDCKTLYNETQRLNLHMPICVFSYEREATRINRLYDDITDILRNYVKYIFSYDYSTTTELRTKHMFIKIFKVMVELDKILRGCAYVNNDSDDDDDELI